MDWFGVVDFGATYCCSCSSSRILEIYWRGVRGVWAVEVPLLVVERFLKKTDHWFIRTFKVVRDDVVFCKLVYYLASSLIKLKKF